MFDKLLPVLEESMKNDSGSMPVVFEGLEQIREEKEANVQMSVHTFHELFFLRSGKVEFIFENTSLVLEPNTTLIIKPHTAHKIRVISKTATRKWEKAYTANRSPMPALAGKRPKR